MPWAHLPHASATVTIAAMSESPTTASQLPILAKRYQLQRPLGEGGMAQVMLAHDLNLQRQVAVKILRQDFIGDPAFRARFRQEARAAANLVHPNIVTVYDSGRDQDIYFLVMEYVEGTDLKTLLRRRGRLPADQAVELMIQICAGVGYAHRAGLVHCDLKPHNILVTPDQRVKITDFGIARALAAIRPDEHHETVWGSPTYFSPEQAAGKPPSPASDVYSLGVIFFEVLTGQPPFQADDPATLTELHQTRPAPSPRAFNPAVPLALEQIVLKVLSKEPAWRYRTADQLGRVLETYAKQEAGEPVALELAPVEAPVQDAYSTTSPLPSETAGGIDWLAVGLGLVAFLMLGGLIPLWLYACLLYPSCPIQLP